MIKTLKIVILLIILSTSCSDRHYIKACYGYVYDNITKLPIDQVKVSSHEALKNALTDKNGYYSIELKLPIGPGEPMSLDFLLEKEGYEKKWDGKYEYDNDSLITYLDPAYQYIFKMNIVDKVSSQPLTNAVVIYYFDNSNDLKDVTCDISGDILINFKDTQIYNSINLIIKCIGYLDKEMNSTSNQWIVTENESRMTKIFEYDFGTIKMDK